MRHRGLHSEGCYVFNELRQLQNSGKKKKSSECVKLPGRRAECLETTAKMTSQRKQCAGTRQVLKGMHLATEREQTDGCLWLIRFRETKIDGGVGREICVDEMFQMLTDGLEVFSPAGLVASEWKALPGRWVLAALVRCWKYKSRQI